MAKGGGSSGGGNGGKGSLAVSAMRGSCACSGGPACNKSSKCWKCSRSQALGASFTKLLTKLFNAIMRTSRASAPASPDAVGVGTDTTGAGAAGASAGDDRTGATVADDMENATSRSVVLH